MKRILLVILLFNAILSANAQEDRLIFRSELDFLNSWYSIDAIMKFRKSIHPTLAKAAEEYSDKFKTLKKVDEFPNSQQSLYKKYENIRGLFNSKYCLMPQYFHKKANGTYTLLFNFIDLGIKYPYESVDPESVCLGLIEKLSSIFHVAYLGVNEVSKTEVSSIGYSFVYQTDGSPRIVAFWTNKQNYKDYYDGKITLQELYARCSVYYTTSIGFTKVQ